METKVINHIDIHVPATWGVHWDEMKTARDFLQNFYDANKVNDIKVHVDENTVQFYAPGKFDYKNLLYVRSTKTNNPDTIGKYGEGFKASLLNAMRNWNCSVEMYVGNKKLRFYFKDMEFDDSDDKIIICELSEIDPIQGTRLVVGNCNSRLITEFKFGLKHFYVE
ncbi:MAG: hypothetical protein FWH41_01075 [Treponema sp.]|nr:hypothetical protein [Treponema sp.]